MAVPNHLVDSNILLRMARRDDPDHAIVNAALAALAEGGAVLYYTHQNVAEFWNVATRPVDRNGFGLTAADVEQQTRVIEKGMAAAMSVHRVTHLLTLNPDDFKRYTHMTAVHPNHLAYPR